MMLDSVLRLCGSVKKYCHLRDTLLAQHKFLSIRKSFIFNLVHEWWRGRFFYLVQVKL